ADNPVPVAKVGLSSCSISLPFGPGWVTQSRSFIWQSGVMQDLGTLGGTDTLMVEMNTRGQIAVTRIPTPLPTRGRASQRLTHSCGRTGRCGISEPSAAPSAPAPG